MFYSFFFIHFNISYLFINHVTRTLCFIYPTALWRIAYTQLFNLFSFPPSCSCLPGDIIFSAILVCTPIPDLPALPYLDLGSIFRWSTVMSYSLCLVCFPAAFYFSETSLTRKISKLLSTLTTAPRILAQFFLFRHEAHAIVHHCSIKCVS